MAAEATEAKCILVCGGAGFIGSHTVIQLLSSAYKVVVVDNYANSCDEAVKRTRELAGGAEFEFVELDLAKQPEELSALCATHKFDACIHFAGLKAVGESVKKPILYYQTNLVSTMNLINSLEASGCRSIVFSSSATVYGDPEEMPITEQTRVGVGLTNPYGKTKYFIEEILRDVAFARPNWRIVLLRYFNPIGAHESGRIGEDPQGIPNNLMPYLSQCAVGRREFLSVFGMDYPTVDGTGVRDYIHVVDLARGHVAALDRDIFDSSRSGVSTYNLGTGQGTSVLQLLKALEKACGKEIKWKEAPRRAGDIATCFADCSLAEKELGWKAQLSIEQACVDTWRWQQQNPYGFREAPQGKEDS